MPTRVHTLHFDGNFTPRPSLAAPHTSLKSFLNNKRIFKLIFTVCGAKYNGPYLSLGPAHLCGSELSAKPPRHRRSTTRRRLSRSYRDIYLRHAIRVDRNFFRLPHLLHRGSRPFTTEFKHQQHQPTRCQQPPLSVAILSCGQRGLTDGNVWHYSPSSSPWPNHKYLTNTLNRLLRITEMPHGSDVTRGSI